MIINKCQFRTTELVYLWHKLRANIFLNKMRENKKHEDKKKRNMFSMLDLVNYVYLFY